MKNCLTSGNHLDILYSRRLSISPLPLASIEKLLIYVPLKQKIAVRESIKKLNSVLEKVTLNDIADFDEINREILVMKNRVEPCKVLIQAKWIAQSIPGAKVTVGDICHWVLVLQPTIWDESGEAIDVMVHIRRTKDFVLDGKSIISARFEVHCVLNYQNINTIHSIPFVISPITSGPISLPVVTFNGPNVGKIGIFFYGPDDVFSMIALPKKKTCRKFFKEQ